MKTKLMIGLMAAMMTGVRIASAQGLTTDVGIPLAGSWNPGGPQFDISMGGQEGVVLPVSAVNVYGATSASPGDVVLLNDANAGDAPSNWAAIIRFFSSSDLTGQLGLPATETEAFFPNDAGPTGFATFSYFPITSSLRAIRSYPPATLSWAMHNTSGHLKAFYPDNSHSSPIPLKFFPNRARLRCWRLAESFWHGARGGGELRNKLLAYMLAIMLSPNSLHLICVAPVICRAKS